MDRVVRIGCGAAFWGDSPEGARQLVGAGVDYLVFDYLAEITMSLLARMKAKDGALGYATDFVTLAMKPLLREIAERRIRVVSNAGGVNPQACRDALERACREAGVSLSIAVVQGDDLSGDVARLRESGVTEMGSGAPLPDRLASINAYLGAFPIAAALAAGADIVITGRCVDSALVLGPLIHEFGWRESDYDLLSAGSLAGHLIECGTQVTGGIVTDWQDVVASWPDMGFPIAECRPDGAVTITIPDGEGGRVTPAAVGEQVIYEVGDPQSYLLPDVVCDWSQVRLGQAAPNRVSVSGARGRAPTQHYKVSATYQDGYRSVVTMMIAGREAVAKAQAVGEAILERCRRLMRAAGLGDFSEVLIELLGAETSYGPHTRAKAAREVILKLGVRHVTRDGLAIFAREIYPAATAMAQGLTGFAGGRPEAQPVMRLFSFLVEKHAVPVSIDLGGRALPVVPHLPQHIDANPARLSGDAADCSGETLMVPLIALAYGRSGDKGDLCNIGVLARDPAHVPVLRAALTTDIVKRYMGHLVLGEVERFEWPGLHGFNFVMHGALGGGGVASLRHDPQGKAMAQILMDLELAVPAQLARSLGA